MATRRERVVLDLEDNLSGGMAKAAAATAFLNRELNELSRTSVQSSRSSQSFVREVDAVGRSSKGAAAEVDRLSGRMRIFFDAAAVLGPSVAPISAVAVPAVTGLASQLGFAAIGMSSLIAASQGVGDALKAVNDAALEPTAANLDKARIAMERLGPEAQEFVARFQELRPVFRDIRDAAAAGWFPGLTDALDSVERVGPRVAAIFEAIGAAGGNLVAEGASALAGPQMAEFLSFVENNAPQALDDLGRTLGNVISGLAELWMAFDPLNDDFSTWLLEASRSFAEWSEGLSRTQGFREFVDYIRTNGPRVADALVAVGDAVLQIVEALAPLGGPSLKIIETFADAIGAIADSDLGTPILAGVAALALYNRTMQAAIALQTRLTGSTALANGMASGGLFGVGRAGAGGLKAAGSELRAVGQNWRYLGTSAAWGEAKQAKALTGLVKGTAVLGGLTVAATGAADGIGLTNTASLALMGTIAGPWGTALGGGVGAVMDLSAALDEGTSSTESFKAALTSGDISQMQTEIEAIGTELRKVEDTLSQSGIGDSIGDFFKIGVQGLGGALLGKELDGKAELGNRKAVLEGQVEATNRAALAQAGFSDALLRTGREAGFADTSLIELANSTRESSDAAWGAFDAQTRLGAAIDDVAAAAKKGKRGLDDASEGGRENRTVLSGLANDWATTRLAMEANGDSAKKIERRYYEVRDALIAAATKMTGSRREAIRLANQLEKPMSLVIKDKSRAAVSSAKAAIAELRRSIEGKPITQYVNIKVNGKNVKAKVGEQGSGLGSLIGGSADGWTVPGPRAPYRDSVLSLLAPGEEVITNRNGEADQFRADRAAGRIPAYADGGMAGATPYLRDYQRSYAVRERSTTPTAATYAIDPAIVERLAAIEVAVNRGTAVNAAEHNDDRRSMRAGSSVAARRRPRGQV